MTRNEFIMTLFDNGYGLTLDQISIVNDYVINQAKDVFPDEPITENILSNSREVFMDDLRDCQDLIEMKDYLRDMIKLNVNDQQVLRLWQISEC